LLQLMPEGDAEYWNHIVHLARTITAKELAELTTDALLTRLFYEEEIHLFAEKPVVFQCNCTQERMENAVLLMGKQEATDILRENKTIIVTCEFCNNYYEFSKTDVARIFSQTYH